MWKETCVCGKRPVYMQQDMSHLTVDMSKETMCGNRPVYMRHVCVKETCVCGKRPVYMQRDVYKRPVDMSKETYGGVKRDVCTWKATYTYATRRVKETCIHVKRNHVWEETCNMRHVCVKETCVCGKRPVCMQRDV